MANLFINFSNGTYESGAVTSAMVATPVPANGSVFQGKQSFDGTPRTGTGLYKINPRIDPLTIGQLLPDYVKLTLRTQYASAHAGIYLQPNKRYTFQTHILVPEGGLELMNDECWVGIGNDNVPETLDAFAIKGAPDVNGVCETTKGSGESRRIFQFIKVSDIHEYKALQYSWKELVPDDASSRVQLYLFVAEADPAATLLEGFGEMYLDDTSIEEAEVCVLELDTPSYVKTNETADDADDGTITINATAGVSDTILYSINGVDYQFSNVFTGLAPGTYTAYAKVNGLVGCEVSITDIVIFPFTPEPPPPVVEGGLLTIDKTPLNHYNFVNWFSAAGNLGFDNILCTNEDWDLPNKYAKIKNEDVFPPIIVSGEMFSFYINFDADFNGADFDQYRLALCNQYGVVLTDIATLVQDLSDDLSSYNILAQVTLPGVNPGKYFLGIYKLYNNQFVMTSSVLEVVAATKVKKLSIRIQYRSSLNVYRYRYLSAAAINYLNTIRLRMNRIDNKTDGDLVQYRAVSSGVLRNTSLELDKFIVLEAQYFSNLMNEAADILPAHDMIIINDKLYVCKSLYNSNYNKLMDVHLGKLELYEQDFSTANRFNGLNVITIVGSDDPLLEQNDEGFIKL